MDLKDFTEGGAWNKAGRPVFDQKLVEQGADIEMEHTRSRSMARRIAKDHLSKTITYYTDPETAADDLREDRKSDLTITGIKKKAFLQELSKMAAVITPVVPDPESGKLKYFYSADTAAIQSDLKDAKLKKRVATNILAVAGGRTPIQLIERLAASEIVNRSRSLFKGKDVSGLTPEIGAVPQRPAVGTKSRG